MTAMQALITVGIIAAGTVLTRALPFLVFGKKETPPLVLYLGRVLPYAIIGMLVVYCLKGVQLSATPHGAPEALGVLAVAALYLWRKNTLLAIAVGTGVYMVLIRVL